MLNIIANIKNNRFKFGQNWRNYISDIGETEITVAKNSLKKILPEDLNLKELSFLDVGCGSGLFSLSACKLDFNKITSFDYDHDSVQATKQLYKKYASDKQNWQIMQGSVLEPEFMSSLGKHDVVYAWGVLHHTGDMWQAINKVIDSVVPKGILCIALYNDQGLLSKYWKCIKLFYNLSPKQLRFVMIFLFGIYFKSVLCVADILRFRNPLKRYKVGATPRGMKFYYDVVDWIGGYPFEVAKPKDVIQYFESKGFNLTTSKLVGWRHGCNEFVFKKNNNVNAQSN